jgi:3-methyladenine DNA glycosylase AlkD
VQFKAPIYDDLLWRFWKDENRITLDMYQYLFEKNADKAFELTKQSLQNANELFGYEDLIAKMLNAALKQERVFAYGIIRQHIKECNVHLFPVFANKAAEIKDNSFVEPLFSRLKRESNPHIYLKVAEVLIAYKEKEIDERLLDTINKNENLRVGWGGEALDDLLNANLSE